MRARCGRRLHGKIGCRTGWNAPYERNHCLDISLRHLAEGVVDGLTHRSRCSAMTRCMSERKIGGDVFIGPAAEAGGLIGRDVEGAPACHRSSGKLLAVIECK